MKLQTSYTHICYSCNMAAKKKTPSAADFRMKEEADKKKMARTDKSGNSGFGAGKKENVLYPLPFVTDADRARYSSQPRGMNQGGKMVGAKQEELAKKKKKK